MGIEKTAAGERTSISVRAIGIQEARSLGWDDYVSRHPGASAYHRLAWLTSICSAYGHQPWCFAAQHQDGSLVGVLPVCEFAVPLLGVRWVSLPFCDLGGPLADDETINSALTGAACATISQENGQSLQLRLSGLPVDEPEQTGPSKVSMICELPDSSDSLFKSYKPKLRSQIRKAEKNELTASVATTPEAVRAFYPVFASNMHRLGSPVHSLRWFLSLQEGYGDQMLIGLVYLGERVIGAGIVLLNGDRACIPWASTLADYNHLAPNMLLYWRLLAEATDRGCRTFDFGRSTAGEGTYRFKKQWGARPVELRWCEVTSEGTLDSESSQSSAGGSLRLLAERAWQRLPFALANWLGPFLRKYISL